MPSLRIIAIFALIAASAVSSAVVSPIRRQVDFGLDVSCTCSDDGVGLPCTCSGVVMCGPPESPGLGSALRGSGLTILKPEPQALGWEGLGSAWAQAVAPILKTKLDKLFVRCCLCRVYC